MPFSGNWPKNFDLSCTIAQFSNLQVLGVKLMTDQWEDCAFFLNMVRKLKKLTRVQLEVSIFCPGCEEEEPDRTGMLVEGMNQIWGVQAKLLTVKEVGGVFYWQAPKGRTLEWSWKLYREKLQAGMIEARAYGETWCDCVPRVQGMNSYSWDEDGGKWYVGPQIHRSPYWEDPMHGLEGEDEEEMAA